MNKAKLKLLWRKWYGKAAMAAVVVIALLAVAGYIALKPTYTADEVTKKMWGYSGGNVSCFTQVWIMMGLAKPHYNPFHKDWRITTVSPSNYTWLFDERTGTITSSDLQCY